MATGNSINANSSGLVRYNGSGTFDGVTTTNHNVLLGAASNGITSLAPSATSGVPVISQGAAADPAFGTAVVAGGGTGQTTLTNHGVLVGAGTSAITQLSVGATGTVMIGSTGADPSFSATPTVTSITFGSGTALSTYVQSTFTPTLSFGGGTTGITYSLQSGEYTQIGNIVHLTLRITLTSKGSSTGAATIALPVNNGGTLCTMVSGGYSGITLDTNYTTVAGFTQSNKLNLQEVGSGQSKSNILDTMFTNTSDLAITGFYFTS